VPFSGRRLRRLRKSTWDTPRFVRGHDVTVGDHLVLPRGLRHTVTQIVERAGSRVEVADVRNAGREIEVAFMAELDAAQGVAVSTLLAHDDGILVAPPGSGKDGHRLCGDRRVHVGARRPQGSGRPVDGSLDRRIHLRVNWARRRHGRLAAFTTGGPDEPDVAVEVVEGRHRLGRRMSAVALAGLDLPWLPTGVVLRMGAQMGLQMGTDAMVVRRKHDRLVTDDGRSVGRFDGLRLMNGTSGADAVSEPGLLEVTYETRPNGPSETAARPMVLPEVIDVLRRLPTRTDSWLCAVSGTGGIVQMCWEDGRLWLETPQPDAGASTGKHARREEAEQMLAILSTEDRVAVAELDGVTTKPW
jgi:hypothetical protein